MAVPKRVALSEVALIEREIVDSTAIETGTLYVGLENIEPGGRFVGVRSVNAGELASSKFAFTPKHLLYGKLRPYLAKIARPDFEGVCSTDILPVLPGPDLDRGYLAWLLLTPEMLAFANARSTGANLPRLSPTALSEIRVPLLPLPEQRRIAEILDKADALRAKRRAALAQLDTLSQAIFLDIFGDPAANPKRFLRTRLDSLVRIGDSINYGVVQPGDACEDGVPLIRVGDLQNGKLEQSSLKRISPAIESAYKRSRLKGDEILISCVGSTGMVALADESMKGFNIARAVARVPLADSVDRTYVASYLQTEFVQRYFENELRTVSQPTLNIKQISETVVLVPPLSQQREFAQRIEAVTRLRDRQHESVFGLNEVFASIQAQAFRGEL